MMKNALKIEQLNVHIRDQHILKDFSLSLDQGDILCLLGPSGCGKTTALKAIAGLIESEQGHITLFSQLIKDNQTEMPPEKREMGFIFQDYALFPHMTVFENVAYALKGMPKSDIKAVVKNNLSLVRLEGLEKRYPHELSGGQQQRTAVARALSNKPKLLLMDEPFSNIDNQVKQKMIAELRLLLKSNNITCIFVTHSKQEAFNFADKTAILNNGRIEQIDSTKSIFEHPSNAFIANFMEAGNIVIGEQLPNELFIDFNIHNEHYYLLKEIGFAINTDKKSGVIAKVVDCLYVGYRYQLTVKLISTDATLKIESIEAVDIGSDVSLQYQHNPVCIDAK